MERGKFPYPQHSYGSSLLDSNEKCLAVQNQRKKNKAVIPFDVCFKNVKEIGTKLNDAFNFMNVSAY